MEIDQRGKRGGESVEKKGEKKVGAEVVEGDGGKSNKEKEPLGQKILVKPLREMWPETAQKHQEEKKRAEEKPSDGKKETKANSPQDTKPPEQNNKQLAELKTLTEVVLDDAERDRSTEQWESTFHKSVICDVIKLGQVKECLLRTDDGKLLEGIQKEGEIYLYSTFSYIQNWCGKVDRGLTAQISTLYEELNRHGKEVYAMTRMKGAARKILEFIEKQLGNV